MTEENAMMSGHASPSESPSDSTLDSGAGTASPPQEAEIQETVARSSRESSRLVGTVKWFNAKAGYGFITRHDTGEDIFAHFSGIGRKNPRHAVKSLGDGELVEFNLCATNVTGVGGQPVRGNPYVGYLPTRRADSFASGDRAMIPNHRYVGSVYAGNSRIPRFNPNWPQRF